MSLAPWGCRSELGEGKDNHQLQRVPRERVREERRLPGQGDGKRGQAPVAWDGGCRERWVLWGAVSRACVLSAWDISAGALSPQGERDQLGAWHACWEDSTLFAFELLRILKIPC